MRTPRAPKLVATGFFAAALLMLTLVLPSSRVEADDYCSGNNRETCEADHSKCREKHGPTAACMWSSAIDECGCGRPVDGR